MGARSSTITDNSFRSGKVGFITKSDAVMNSRRPDHLPPDGSLRRNPGPAGPGAAACILNLKIYGKTPAQNNLHVLAARTLRTSVNPPQTRDRRAVRKQNLLRKNGPPDPCFRSVKGTETGRPWGGQFFLKPFLPGKLRPMRSPGMPPTVRWMEAQLAASEGVE